MQDIETRLEVIDAIERRRAERRTFLRFAGGAAASAGALSLLAACGDDDEDMGAVTPTPTPTPTPTSTSAAQDVAVLNFALNLEYLEAQFYSYAAFGYGLESNLVSGSGSAGSVTGGAQVPFTDTVVAQYAREIALDEREHVRFLRTALGGSAVAMPNINISGDASGPFTAAASAAGIPLTNGVFNPYASDENFLLGAFIFEDVGVTAYKGSITLISNKTYIEAAAGIHAVEAYHAGLIRTTLYAKGVATPALRTYANAISNARDSLDGTTDLDQGIVNPDGTANLVPTDSNGITFSRSAAQVLNIVYLNKAQLSAGGFFPNGVNGTIRTSAASG